MRIVVFGANAPTGRLLTRQALAEGHEVTAFTREPERAREHVATSKRLLESTPAQHHELRSVFVAAITRGDVDAIADLLVQDVVLVVDPGPEPQRYGQRRELRRLGAPRRDTSGSPEGTVFGSRPPPSW